MRKAILLILFNILLCVIANSQVLQNINGPGIRTKIVKTDSAFLPPKFFVHPPIKRILPTLDSVGAIYYNPTDSTYYGMANSQWRAISSTGPGVNIYNSNGTLTGPRLLTGAGYGLTFVGLSSFSIDGTDALINGVTAGRGSGLISSNTTFGESALSSNSSGSQLVGIGRKSLYSNTTGYGNIAVGDSALYSNIGGYYNTAFGVSSLHNNTSGHDNASYGNGSMYSNTIGERNSAFGLRSMDSLISGMRNTALGWSALASNKTSDSNIAIGYRAAIGLDGGKNNTHIGNGGSGIVTGNNTVTIGAFLSALSPTLSDHVQINDGAGNLAYQKDNAGNVRIPLQRLANDTIKKIIVQDAAGDFYRSNWPAVSSATVSSVGLTMPSGFSVSGSPVTSSGTLAVTTTLNGVLKGNGSGLLAATSGTDYSPGTSALGTGILKTTTGTGNLTIAVAGDFPTLNQNTTGSAATLTTPRNINGVSFNGSANITVTADASTLTNTTLNSTVVNSSLTSTGTVTTGTWNAPIQYKTVTKTADYTMVATDCWVAVTNTLAPRTITLPAASSVNAGYIAFVSDETGSASTTNTITVARAGSDNIDGGTTSVITTGYGVKGFKSNGSSKWFLYIDAIKGDPRLNPTPTGGGKIIYDNGGGYSETAAGTSGQVLKSNGTSAPIWGTAGGSVISFFLNTGQTFGTNSYVGIGGDGSSAINTNIVPWVAPVAGTLSNLRVSGLANAGSTTHILIYKATGAISPSYSATALDVTVSSGTFSGTDITHSVSVNAGDLIVGFSTVAWSTNGACINVMFTPN